MSRTSGAIASGLARFDPGLSVAGFILNRVGSATHAAWSREAVERATGARPGQKLQVDFLGAASIEDAIRSTGRRLALSAGAASGLVGAAATAAAGTAGWISITFACVAGVFGSWLALDLARRR